MAPSGSMSSSFPLGRLVKPAFMIVIRALCFCEVGGWVGGWVGG